MVSQSFFMLMRETITTYCFLGSGYRDFVYERHLLKDFLNVRILVKNMYFGFLVGTGCG